MKNSATGAISSWSGYDILFESLVDCRWGSKFAAPPPAVVDKMSRRWYDFSIMKSNWLWFFKCRWRATAMTLKIPAPTYEVASKRLQSQLRRMEGRDTVESIDYVKVERALY